MSLKKLHGLFLKMLIHPVSTASTCFSLKVNSTTKNCQCVCSAAFAAGHCYEPFVKYGNLTSSDNTWAVGAVVEFACDPGYTLEQGSVTIECMDPSNPQWNETEPACRGLYLPLNVLLWVFDQHD